MTKLFCDFQNIFLDFTTILKLLSSSKSIWGSNNFIEICKQFLDLINCLKMISQKHCDLKYFFSDLKHILGLSLIGFCNFLFNNQNSYEVAQVR